MCVACMKMLEFADIVSATDGVEYTDVGANDADDSAITSVIVHER